jgi:dolichyl-phosphate-mannose--protein O-mannosyl transferase
MINLIKQLFTNGNSSRKFALAVFALLLILGLSISCAWSAGIAGILTTAVGGITGLFGLYAGGNVLSKKWGDKEGDK